MIGLRRDVIILREVGMWGGGGRREGWPSVPLLSCCDSGGDKRGTVCSGFGRSGWKSRGDRKPDYPA